MRKPKKKHDYSDVIYFHITGVPRNTKKMVNLDRNDLGIEQSTLIKTIVENHYKSFPFTEHPNYIGEGLNTKSDRFNVTNIPARLKKIIKKDCKQKGVSESDLLKFIIDIHYQKNPLNFNPYFLED